MDEKPNQYFEGTIQLRNPSDEIIEAAASEIEKTPSLFVAKTKKVTNGIDVYISSQRALRSLGNKLQKRFACEITFSKKLFSKNNLTCKEVYRVYMLVRIPSFKKGDVIRYKGEDVKILGMSKKILAKNLETGKKLTLNYRDVPR